MQADVIIIGGGTAGVHAALPLLDAGLKVLMLDAGQEPGPAGSQARVTCIRLNEADLLAMKLPVAEMQRAYDEIRSFIDASEAPSGSSRADLNADVLLRKASEREQILRELDTVVLGCSSGSPDAVGMSPHPSSVLEELKRNPRFTYVPGLVAESMIEDHETTAVASRLAGSGIRITHRGRAVVLAGGAIGTAKLLLRSLRMENARLPILAGDKAYIHALNPRTFGKPAEPGENGCPLVFLDQVRDALGFESACALVGSYRPQPLSPLLRAVPLPVPEAMGLLSLLSPSLLIANVRFPAANAMGMLRWENQTMHAEIPADAVRLERRQASLKRLRLAMQALGLWTVKTMNLLEDGTSNYAGTVPISDNPSIPLSAEMSGKVRQMRHVFAADASLFEVLPAKPHALTVMANARRIARDLASQLL